MGRTLAGPQSQSELLEKRNISCLRRDSNLHGGNQRILPYVTFTVYDTVYRTPCFSELAWVIWHSSISKFKVHDRMFYGIVWCCKIIILKKKVVRCSFAELVHFSLIRLVGIWTSATKYSFSGIWFEYHSLCFDYITVFKKKIIVKIQHA